MAQVSLVILFILIILLDAVWMSDAQVLIWKWERTNTLILDAHVTEAENALFVGVSLRALENLYKAKFQSYYNVTFANCKHLDTYENTFSFNCQVLYTVKSTDLTRKKRQIDDLDLNFDFPDFSSVLVQSITDLLNEAKNNETAFGEVLTKAINGVSKYEINGTFVLEGATKTLLNGSLDHLHKEYNQSNLDGLVIANITSSNATVSVIHPVSHPMESSSTSTTDSSTIPVAKETSFSPSTEQTSMSTSTVYNITFPGKDEVSTGPSAGETNKSTRKSTASNTAADQSSSETTLMMSTLSAERAVTEADSTTTASNRTSSQAESSTFAAASTTSDADSTATSAKSEADSTAKAATSEADSTNMAAFSTTNEADATTTASNSTSGNSDSTTTTASSTTCEADFSSMASSSTTSQPDPTVKAAVSTSSESDSTTATSSSQTSEADSRTIYAVSTTSGEDTTATASSSTTYEADAATLSALTTIKIATESVDLCSEKKHNCAKNAKCTPTKDSFSCTCSQGFTGDGTQCADIDECSYSKSCHEKAGCINTAGSFICACIKGYTGSGTHCAIAKIRQMQRNSTITVEGLMTPLSKALLIGASIIEMESYYERTMEQNGFQVVSTNCKHISIVGNNYTFTCLANYMPKNLQIQTNRKRRQVQESPNFTNDGSEITEKVLTIMTKARTNSTIFKQLFVQYESRTTENTQAELRVMQQYSQLSNDDFDFRQLRVTVTSDKPVFRDMEQPVPIQTTQPAPIQTTAQTRACDSGYGGNECDELEVKSPLVIGLISAASLLLLIVLGLGICLWRRCAGMRRHQLADKCGDDKVESNSVSDSVSDIERVEQPLPFTNLHRFPDSFVKIPRPRYVPGVVKPTFEVEDDYFC